MVLFFSLLHQVEAKNLYNDGTYVFTERNAKELVVLAQYIAGSEFTAQEKIDMEAFALAEFKTLPSGAVGFYNSLSATIPKIVSPNTDSFFRVEIYLYMATKIKFAKSLDNHPGQFFRIIDRYNPPFNEAWALQEYRFNLAYYTYQNRQFYFNQMMNTYQQSSQLVIDSIKDTSTRQSIYLSGNTIVAEYDGYYIVETPDGQQYNYNK